MICCDCSTTWQPLRQLTPVADYSKKMGFLESLAALDMSKAQACLRSCSQIQQQSCPDVLHTLCSYSCPESATFWTKACKPAVRVLLCHCGLIVGLPYSKAFDVLLSIAVCVFRLLLHLNHMCGSTYHYGNEGHPEAPLKMLKCHGSDLTLSGPFQPCLKVRFQGTLIQSELITSDIFEIV